MARHQWTVSLFGEILKMTSLKIERAKLLEEGAGLYEEYTTVPSVELLR